MDIQAVIVDELPRDCGDCEYIESREKGRGVVYECTFVSGFIVNKAKCLPNCPLVLVGEYATQKVKEYLAMLDKYS